jgi:hypothetical protein
VTSYTSYLAPDVAELIAAENARWDGQVETSWVGQWDFTREVVTSVRLLYRGNNAQVSHTPGDVGRAEVDIHNHTLMGYLHGRGIACCFPSETDTRVAAELGRSGAGMLILSHNCEYGFLVRAPRPYPKKNGSASRFWSFSVGRWDVMAAITNTRLNP